MSQVASLICLLFKEIAVGDFHRAQSLIAAASSESLAAAVRDSVDSTAAADDEEMDDGAAQ